MHVPIENEDGDRDRMVGMGWDGTKYFTVSFSSVRAVAMTRSDTERADGH